MNETYVLEEFKNEDNRITREIDVLKKANHNSLITYIDDFYIINDFGNKEYVIVMEYFEGQTLRKLITDKVPDERLLELFKRILEGIKALHNTIFENNGIIHRDLKPDNILVNENNQVKIIDYGLSKIIDFSTITSTGSQIGSPLYMSPEQVKDSKRVDEKADIYALGIIFYEIITGNVPYKATTLPELIVKILNEPIIPPSNYRPSISANIQKIIYKATEKDSFARFKNIEEFENALTEERVIEERTFAGKYYAWTYKEKTVAESFGKNRKMSIIYPIHVMNWSKGLNALVEKKYFDAIIDPSTQRLSYITFSSTTGLKELAYAPSEGVINLDYLQNLQNRNNYILNWYKTVSQHDKLILPYHYISNTDYPIDKIDDWIKMNIQLINESSVIAKDKEKYSMISINLNHLIIQSDKLLSYYLSTDVDGYIVQVSDMKQLNEQSIKGYINFMVKLQKYSNKPVIALKVPISIGLALISKGIHGFSLGIASIEYFDEQYIKEESDPYNMFGRYYFPELLSFQTYPRNDKYSFLPLYKHFNECNCQYCKDKEWIELVEGDSNVQLHFLEQMYLEVELINKIIDVNKKVEYYKDRLSKAIENYSSIPRSILRDKTNTETFKVLKNLLKIL